MRSAIESLEAIPHRHSVAEALTAELDVDIHKRIVGNYLIFCYVEASKRLVHVVRFRHGARMYDGP